MSLGTLPRQHRQAGFSTIEVLIASSVAFTLLIAIASMMTNVRKQTQGGQAQIDTQIALNNLMAAMSSGGNCAASLNTSWNKGESGAPGVSPLETNPQTIEIKDPMGSSTFLKVGDKIPGSVDLKVNKLQVTLKPPASGTPAAKWMKRQIVTDPPTSPPAYEWCWLANAQYQLDIELENTAIAAKRATGATTFERSFLITATQQYGNCQPESSGGSAASGGTAPSSSNDQGWSFTTCGMGAGGGYMVTGVNECVWCPRANSTADPLNDACLGFADPDQSASLGPGYRPFPTAADLELREMRFLRSLDPFIGSAHALLDPNTETGGGGGGGGGGGSPAPPPSTPYYLWGANTAGAGSGGDAGVGSYSSQYRTPGGCGVGYYQAGIQMRSVANATGGAAVPPRMVCSGKFATCTSSGTTTGSTDIEFAVLCCKVGIQ